MTSLETAIRRLTDADAVELVSRLVAAQGGGVSLRPDEDAPDAVASALSLPEETVDIPSDGELARSILLLLAADPRYRKDVAALLEAPAMRSFGAAPGKVAALEMLQLLDTGFDAFRAPLAVGKEMEHRGLMRTVAQQLLASAGLRKSGTQADAEYRVWYATTRRPVDPADPSRGFGVERDDAVHYGNCTVFVPKSHKIGMVGSPWWKRLATLTDDRLRLTAIASNAEAAFWRGVTEQLAQTAEDSRDALVFVHGFNVDFQEAALRAAQIGFDLQFRGAMAFYSWASRGELGKYLADEAAVELDEDVIAGFLSRFAAGTGARKVHVIAHSMGNRAVLRAVDRIARDAQGRSGVRFGQFVLAAPDVDARKFRQLSDAYRAVAERTTLYISSRDLAVETSKWLHDFPRAGLLPPVTVAAGIDTVNVANADLTLLGHGYVAEARNVLSDIHALLRNGAPPDSRFGIRPMTTAAGEHYWMIGA